jgi:hypothetical protein
MTQNFNKDKMDSPVTSNDYQAGMSVGYDLALTSLLSMLDELDPLSSSELRARLGLEEDDRPTTSTYSWHPSGAG